MEIRLIKKQFLCGAPIKEIEFKDVFKNISWENQERLINETVLHKLNVESPLKTDYQVLFLKHVIQELENYNTEEIHDCIYEQLAVKLEEEKPDFSYKHFLLDEGEHEDDAITIKESNSFIRDGTTGLKLWPAAMALGEFIVQNKSHFDGKSIVELGSGATAFVGMVLMKTCRPEKVILSDCHESVIQTLVENVSLNLSRYETEVMEKSLYVRQRLKKKDGPELGVIELPWEDIDKCADELVSLCQPNILIAADVVYDDTIFEALIKNVATFEKFCNLLHVNGFKISEESIQNSTISNVSLNEIKILRISK